MTDRRELILAAAEQVFADKGFHEAGIADIARRLGMGHGTFYRYFENKLDIGAKVLERVIARFAEAGLSEDPESANTLEEYEAQTLRILDRMMSLVDTDPAVVRFFHEQSVQVDPARMDAMIDGYVVFSARFLHNGIAKGFLRADLDVEPTSQALVALIFEGTRRAVAGQTPEERMRWVRAGVDLVMRGMRA